MQASLSPAAGRQRRMSRKATARKGEEMKVFVYRQKEKLNGGLKFFSQEVESLRNDIFHELLGTTELDIEPVKKEVVKEEAVQFVTSSMENGNLVSARWIPIDAYDVKLVYKVKE
jgi:hypothetical protein